MMTMMRMVGTAANAAKRISSLLLCAIALCAGVSAQSVVGVWQGTAAELQYPRVTLKIAKNEDGSLHGSLYRYDQDASNIPLTEVSFRAPEFRAGVAWIDAVFQGAMSTDGKSIAGTWTQNKRAYPLVLSLATPETMWSYTRTTPAAPMAATADPAFEVATIKPSAPDAKRRGDMRTRHFSMARYSVDDLIEFAYQVRGDQIDASPANAEWMKAENFDIAGEPDAEGQPSVQQWRVMLQKLLADRFHLKLHTVQRTFAAYALELDKPSAKIVMTEKTANTYECRIFTRTAPDGRLIAQFSNMSMLEFTHTLANFIKDRHIVDETGLAGDYDFTLMVPMSVMQGGDGTDPGDDMIRAVQQVGFKLVPKKAALTVLVVNAVERPSAN